MEYVCTGATLKCTMGTATSTLKATPKNVTLVGKDQANIADYVSMTNVPGFGKCRSLAYPPTASATAANHGRLTPMPCVPGTCPKWQAVDKDSLVCGEPALLKPATLECIYGGTISIADSGQKKEIKCNTFLSSDSQDIDAKVDKHPLYIKGKNDKGIEHGNDKIWNDDSIGIITGGAAPLESTYSNEMPFQSNEAVFEHVLLDVLNPMINGNNSNVAATIERTARRYTSANLKNILNSISIAIDISSTEILIIKKGRYTSTFGNTSINLESLAEVKKNQYKVKYSLTDISNYLSHYRDDTKVGILVKALPKNQKPSESMFRDTRNLKWFPLKDPNDEEVIIDLNLEENKDYYAVVYIEALYKRNYLFSNVRRIR